MTEGGGEGLKYSLALDHQSQHNPSLPPNQHDPTLPPDQQTVAVVRHPV